MNSLLINKKTPQILSLAADRAGQWAQHSWKWLHSFRGALLRRVENQKRVSTRTMRSDQRQAIHQLLQIILSHLDLKTMQVGFYHQETQMFVHLSIGYLSRKAQLSERRTQRALCWLQQSGYLSAFRQSSYDELTNEYIHKPSVRRVHQKLLFELGITPRALHKARTRSSQNYQNRLISKKLNQNTGVSLKTNPVGDNTLATILKLPFAKPKKPIPTHPPPSVYYEKINKIMSIFPNISFEEAKNMLPHP
tara:strand:- start:31561 stop:32310 length:750 start_codon:yes stop_codon:yes gene_type:complete